MCTRKRIIENLLDVNLNVIFLLCLKRQQFQNLSLCENQDGRTSIRLRDFRLFFMVYWFANWQYDAVYNICGSELPLNVYLGKLLLYI